MFINNGAVSTKYYSKVDIQNRPLRFSIQGERIAQLYIRFTFAIFFENPHVPSGLL